jgi:hypothetical protein
MPRRAGARRWPVGGRRVDVRLDRAAEVGDLLGPLVHQQHELDHVGAVGGDGGADLLQHDRLARLGRRDDQHALAETDGRDDVDHPRQDLLRGGLHHQAVVGVDDGQVLEGGALGGLRGRQPLHRVGLDQLQAPVASHRLAGELHPGPQLVAVDHVARNVRVVLLREEVELRRAQAAVAAVIDVEHALDGDRRLLLPLLLVARLVLLVALVLVARLVRLLRLRLGGRLLRLAFLRGRRGRLRVGDGRLCLLRRGDVAVRDARMRGAFRGARLPDVAVRRALPLAVRPRPAPVAGPLPEPSFRALPPTRTAGLAVDPLGWGNGLPDPGRSRRLRGFRWWCGDAAVLLLLRSRSILLLQQAAEEAAFACSAGLFRSRSSSAQ